MAQREPPWHRICTRFVPRCRLVSSRLSPYVPLVQRDPMPHLSICEQKSVWGSCPSVQRPRTDGRAGRNERAVCARFAPPLFKLQGGSGNYSVRKMPGVPHFCIILLVNSTFRRETRSTWNQPGSGGGNASKNNPLNHRYLKETHRTNELPLPQTHPPLATLPFLDP